MPGQCKYISVSSHTNLFTSQIVDAGIEVNYTTKTI